MNTQNYPTWLVPLDIARELKEIGYKEDCYFEFSKDNGLTLETLERESSIIGIDDLLFGKNECWQNISVPTWTEVFAWFREKGYESYIKLESQSYIDEGCYYYFEITNPNLYQLDCQGNFDSYEDAREALLKALIQTYKNELKKNNL